MTCLLTLDADGLPKLCEQLSIDVLSPEEAVQSEVILNKIQKYVDETNKNLAMFYSVRSIFLLKTDSNFSIIK